VLSRKHASVLFLQSLASSSRQNPVKSSFLPTLTLPPPPRNVTPNLPDPIFGHQPKGKSKAELLREYRLKSGYFQLPYYLLDTQLSQVVLSFPSHCFFVMHCTSCKESRESMFIFLCMMIRSLKTCLSLWTTWYVPRNAVNAKTNNAPQRYIVTTPTKALIHRLSEVGYLYTRVAAFVRDREAASGVGMIEQSLCHHLQSQLTEYYRLIAILESQMAFKDPRGDETPVNTPNDSAQSIGEETGLTLRRLDVWINDWRLRMRMMSVCVEGARGG
jgi:gamma-tubulin complex component 3